MQEPEKKQSLFQIADKVGSSPLAPLALAVCSKSRNSYLVSIPFIYKNPLGFPKLVPTIGITGFLGFCGYALSDPDNSYGVTSTCAWTLSWLVLNSASALKSRRIGPIALFSGYAVVGSAFCYKYYKQKYDYY
ncbi:hypothetical protein BB560_002182 [Smittium megazygosporum]|uniref:Altered inheritance of mitochondria protein 19 homolog n=1 Tax=Smittium megazygosporum TaxID=133381 RepID=A0A2T9ZFG0_9FUNG|nr:hypothetical protein BB560_002182 [Smittium megazygosporum]